MTEPENACKALHGQWFHRGHGTSDFLWAVTNSKDRQKLPHGIRRICHRTEFSDRNCEPPNYGECAELRQIIGITPIAFGVQAEKCAVGNSKFSKGTHAEAAWLPLERILVLTSAHFALAIFCPSAIRWYSGSETFCSLGSRSKDSHL